MLTLRRPSQEQVDRYLSARREMVPTATVDEATSRTFHHDEVDLVVGHGQADFERARRGVDAWAAHRGAGVEVYPAEAVVRVGATVAVLTRQLGVWVLAACRVIAVEAEPTAYGFTYATLPDHPECGIESFTVRLVDAEVRFEITADSRPGIALVAIGAPVTRRIQQRATTAYLRALRTWVHAGE